RKQRLEVFENRLRLKLFPDRDHLIIDGDQQTDVIDNPIHHGKVAAVFFHLPIRPHARDLMMLRRLLATDPRARTAAAAHRGAHLHHIFGRLAARHPEVAHQDVRHARGEPVADCRLGAELRVEHRIDLLPGETLFHENIDQPRQSDFAARAVHDRDYFRTGHADAADQTGALAAIDASHQEIDRLKVSIAWAPECIAGPASPKEPRKSLKRPCARKIGAPASTLTLLPAVDGRKYDG